MHCVDLSGSRDIYFKAPILSCSLMKLHVFFRILVCLRWKFLCLFPHPQFDFLDFVFFSLQFQCIQFFIFFRPWLIFFSIYFIHYCCFLVRFSSSVFFLERCCFSLTRYALSRAAHLRRSDLIFFSRKREKERDKRGRGLKTSVGWVNMRREFVRVPERSAEHYIRNLEWRMFILWLPHFPILIFLDFLRIFWSLAREKPCIVTYSCIQQFS